MTEAEWLTGSDPKPMAETAVACARASDRTCRLFVAAFWGWQALRLLDGRRVPLLKSVATTEHWAETGELPAGLRASASAGIIFFGRNARETVTRTVHAPRPSWTIDWQEALLVQPPLFREIFGNPFRPVVLDSSWLTSDVVALARGIYEERAFDRMPILGDALQDAGCENDDILAHCRGEGPHVRGCWVVDLVLGRE
jgi:hypothetical protein